MTYYSTSSSVIIYSWKLLSFYLAIIKRMSAFLIFTPGGKTDGHTYIDSKYDTDQDTKTHTSFRIRNSHGSQLN